MSKIPPALPLLSSFSRFSITFPSGIWAWINETIKNIMVNILKVFTFQGSLKFTAKLSGRCTFLMHLYQSGAFVIIDEPTWAHHFNHFVKTRRVVEIL